MKIEQMLHGYDNGHRLLAASVLLKDNSEMDVVAILSDWSEYVGGGKGDSSYMTAYPLRESGYYVIAKTWYAEEMKRPGCVWTQSLLVPMSELNHMDDYRRLAGFFNRPSTEEGYEPYSHSIDYENKNVVPDSYHGLDADGGRVGTILASFVQNTGPVYYKAGVESRPELLLLSLMNVLPADMAEKVSWCTGSAYVRKLYSQPLSCQFLTGNIEENTIVALDAQPQWVRYLCFGIERGDVNQGQLIRMFSEDIKESGSNYVAIVSILFTLEDYFKTEKTSEERYKDVLILIAESFPHIEEGRVIKKLCANKSFGNRYCRDEAFFYYFATLPLDGVFDVEDTKINERWNEYVIANYSQYLEMLERIGNARSVNAWGEAVLRDSAGILTPKDVTHLVASNNHLFNTISFLNPTILNKIEWNELKRNDVESVLPIIVDNRSKAVFTEWDGLFRKLLVEGITIEKSLATAIFGKSNNATTILLDFVNGQSSRYVGYSLSVQLCKQTEAILVWLKGVTTITDNVAKAIVNVVNEHSNTVLSHSAKVWRPFIGLQFHTLRADIYAFMFSLSFNWPNDKTALELMRISFYPLHTLQANGALGYSEWSRVSRYMESLFFLEEWDKCKKMRKTVVKRLKRANLGKSILNHYTPNEELNDQLKKMW